ncbi:MAG TPA: hypothetical protein VK095_07890 [Beutenbergiaceae bacterium]|nr:hypothetical protein [Beutenbergiaceae bacterium]
MTSKSGWKFDDTIYDLGMRLSDIAHQDYRVRDPDARMGTVVHDG